MKKETIDLIKSAQNILVISRLQPNGDALGSMLALNEALVQLGKNATAVSTEVLPESLKFLPNLTHIQNKLTGNRELTIELKTAKTKVGAMKYDTEDDSLKIIISPKNGEFEPDDIKVSKGDFQFDCIVILDTPDVASLDDVYDEHARIFESVPVINIDHHSSNEEYGTVNLVDTEATSTAEMLVPVLESLGVELTKSMATNLLAGIIADTYSFKDAHTTPKSLSVSAHLLGAGADKAAIIEHLYGTKPTSQLKLWGRVLARLEEDDSLGLVYSSLSHQDFVDCKGSPEQVKGIVDELLSHTKSKLIALLIEREPNKISVRLRSPETNLALKVAKAFEGSGMSHAAGFELENMSLKDATAQVLAGIDKLLKPAPIIKPRVLPQEPKKVTHERKEKLGPPRIKPLILEDADSEEDDDEIVLGPSQSSTVREGTTGISVWQPEEDDAASDDE